MGGLEKVIKTFFSLQYSSTRIIRIVLTTIIPIVSPVLLCTDLYMHFVYHFESLIFGLSSHSFKFLVIEDFEFF